jgi:hypothetical protein
MSAPSTAAQSIVPWIAISISVVALGVSLLSYFDRGKTEVPSTPVSAPPAATVPQPGQPIDLSTISPREAADRLFNRVMSASENGNNAEAARFTPMALQAYENLGTLDNDAHYHVALIHLIANDIKGAREQIDLLRKSVPKHLLGYMIEHQIAERSGNKDSGAQAYKSFLAAYSAEIAAGRPEYQDHMKSIESFQKAAQASSAEKK